MPLAWVLGPSGTWGEAIAGELLDRGYDVVGLGPRDVPALVRGAVERGRGWSFAQLDLAAVTAEAAARLVAEPPSPGTLPDVVVDAALSHAGGRDELVRANFLAKALLIEALASAMTARGSGRIGV